MPTRSRRARNKKRCQKKSSGGKTVIHYGAEKASFPCCSGCGQKLAGLPRQDSFKLSKIPGNQRRVERMHSGNMCHGCLRSLLRQAARNL
jgi:ribosomal protein L34E